MGDDAVLDAYLEAWELHRAPPVNIADSCASLKRLLPPDPAFARRSAAARRPSAVPSHPAVTTMQRAARCFFVLRRTATDLVLYGPCVPQSGPQQRCPPWNCWSTEKMHFAIPEEAASLSFQRGDSFEVGLMDRVVCSVAAEHGKQMRYLLLHDYWLILAQPDLSMPGWVIVKTLWPLRQVQPLIDRSDPRTLWVAMQGFRGGAFPGDTAPPYNSASQLATSDGDDRLIVFFTLALNFDDVKRCHAADQHLQKRRQELRIRLLQNASSFVERCCVQQPPQLSV